MVTQFEPFDLSDRQNFQMLKSKTAAAAILKNRNIAISLTHVDPFDSSDR